MTSQTSQRKNSEVSHLAKKELAKRELAKRYLLDFIQYNFSEYEANWHHKLLINKLEKVEKGEIKRLMVFMPPRHGKSEICSIQFPAWFIGRNPSKSIVEASYSADLAHDFGRQTRNLINSQEYKNIFDVKLSEDSQSKGKWNTNKRGAYTAVGVGGSLTGKGADVLLIDDPVKDRQDADSEVVREGVWNWYRSTARTRLSPTGAIVLVMTRWHDDDLAGRLLAQDASGWEIVSLKAIAEQDDEYRKEGEPLWKERFTLENLQSTKNDIGSFEWSSLYQQEPVDDESQTFKKKWFRYKERDEVRQLNTRNFLTIDTRGSDDIKKGKDYHGLTRNYVDGHNNWHIISQREKIDGIDLINLIFAWYDEDKYEKIGIEKTLYTEGLKPFLEEEMRKRNIFLPIEELSHQKTAKEVRIKGLVPRYERGAIFHIMQDGRNTCLDLEGELIRFPKAINDDASDSLANQSEVAEPQMQNDDNLSIYSNSMV